MITTVIVLIYTVGCILSYGRVFASFYAVEEKYCTKGIKPSLKEVRGLLTLITILSWLGFFTGTYIYFLQKEKYFLKYSLRKLKTPQQNS